MAVRYLGPPSRTLVDYHLERGGMPFHGVVEELAPFHEGVCFG